jgi:hypothetical protein
MPNHVTNILTIEGEQELVQKCLSEIKGQNEDQYIDFNSFAPMPKELENTQSPVKIISQEEYDAQEARITAGELTEIEKNWGFSRGITQKMSKRFKEEFGADNWYDWHLANWGTKWNAYDQISDEGSNVITFSTAWSTPEDAMIALSAKYPELTFHIRYADEDFGHNVGEYTVQDGETIEDNVPKGGSLDAYRMAMEIRDDQDYYLVEHLINDAEEGDNFTEKMIELAHEQKYLEEDYPLFVLEKLKELAIRDEQYERVEEIEKIIQEKPAEVDEDEE